MNGQVMGTYLLIYSFYGKLLKNDIGNDWKKLLNNENSILFSAVIVIDIQYFFQPLLLLENE